MGPDRRTTRRTAPRLAGLAAIAVLSLEAVYLLAGNLVLSTRLLRDALGSRPEKLVVDYGRAYTVLPGRVHLSGFSLRMQDAHIQLQLTVARARVDVSFLSLLRKTFHGDHVRCEGVSFHLVHKVHDTAGLEPRLAAYPPIPGFARPALLDVPPPPPPTQAEIDAMWKVRLDDVEAGVRDLWFLEYRWQGNGRVTGAFELSPLRRLRVAPAELALDGGELRAGPHRVAEQLRLRLRATVGPFDVQAFKGIRVFRAVSASAQLALEGFSPALLALHLPHLAARGAGAITGDVRLDAGRFATGSRVSLELRAARGELGEFVYQGSPRLDASVDASGDGEAVLPQVHVRAPGSIVVPVPRGGTARIDLEGLAADLTLAGDDLAEGIGLAKLSSRIGEARVSDARPIRYAVSAAAPLPFLGTVLGDGPLIASGGLDETEEVTIARLREARLGAAELHGAARGAGGRWDGAAAGHLGFIPIGIRLKASRPEVSLFVPDGWLERELATAGIRFAEARP